MTKKQLLFASAALAAVVATEGTTDAHADDVKVSTPATTQVAPATTSTTGNTVVLNQTAPKTDATATTEAPKADATATTEAPKADATATTEAPKTVAPKATVKPVAPKATVTPKVTQPKATVAAKRDDDAMYNKSSDYLENLNNKLTQLLAKNPDLDMSDAQYDAFLKEFYDDPIDAYNALLDYVEKYDIDDDDFNDLLDDFEEYINGFETDLLDEDEDIDADEAIEANTGATTDTKHAGSTATKQSNAVVSTQAQTRMEKFHGSNAKTLPNTGSDQQNGLAVAGAALLAGLGAVGFGLKKRG
jgi:LPXTG-motif cell wall-anchored protein